MHRFRTVQTIAAVLLVLCVAAAMAGKYDKKTLVGSWEFNVPKMLKMAADSGEIPAGVDIEAMAKSMYVRITFEKDGTYSSESKMAGNVNIDKGTWEIVASEGDTLTMKSVDEEGTKQTVAMVFTDKDNFDAVITEGDHIARMSASRVKDEKKTKEKNEDSSEG